MSINFTGIKNLQIATAKAENYGSYLNNISELVQGEKHYTFVSIKGDLDNSVMKGEDPFKKGFMPHLTQYFNALKKMENFDLLRKITNFEHPGKFEIIMKHFHAPDDLGEVNQASFFFNGQQVPILNRKLLPLYTFMARTTRDILNFFNLPEQAEASVKLVNKSIEDTAVEFIENMSL